MEKRCILIVDDEPKILHLVREVLTAIGYEIISTNNGEQAIHLTAIEQPDLVLLDIVLPGEISGFQVARRLRDFTEVPIIMLTAMTAEADLLKGFEVGADDYITKPFSSKELIARVRAVLKRSNKEQAPTGDSEMTCDNLSIDLARRQVRVGGKEVHLTATEYNLLHELALHANQVVQHEHLLTSVWGPEYRDDVDYLRAYIYNLRQKLEEDPNNPKVILRYPSVGYMLACESHKAF